MIAKKSNKEIVISDFRDDVQFDVMFEKVQQLIKDQRVRTKVFWPPHTITKFGVIYVGIKKHVSIRMNYAKNIVKYVINKKRYCLS